MSEETDLPGIVQQVIKLLTVLEPADRARVMRAVGAFFVESAKPGAAWGDGRAGTPGDEGEGESVREGLPRPVVLWCKRNQVATEHLEQVFHIDEGKVSLIADRVPGVTQKDQTVNCYILEGVRAFIETGSPKFNDADAVQHCKAHGCYNETNHATYRSAGGNKMTGDRKNGWSLSAPGLAFGALLVKQIAAQPEATPQ